MIRLNAIRRSTACDDDPDVSSAVSVLAIFSIAAGGSLSIPKSEATDADALSSPSIEESTTFLLLL